MRQIGRVEEGMILAHRSLSRSEDETEIRAGEGAGGKDCEGHPPDDAAETGNIAALSLSRGLSLVVRLDLEPRVNSVAKGSGFLRSPE